MTALAEDTNVRPEEDLRYVGPFAVAEDALIYQGALVAINDEGYAVPASADVTLTVIGHARAQADNTGGDDGDIMVNVDRAPCRKVNASSGDAITNEHLNQLCYVVDDNTVANNSDDGARPVAGIVRHVGTTILVEFDPAVTLRPGAAAPGGVALDVTTNCATAFTDADGAQTINIGDPLVAGAYIGWTEVGTAVTGGGTSENVIEVGVSGNADYAIDGFSAFTTSGLVPRVGDSGVGFILSATTQLTMSLTATGGNVADVVGSVRVLIRRIGQ